MSPYISDQLNTEHINRFQQSLNAANHLHFVCLFRRFELLVQAVNLLQFRFIEDLNASKRKDILKILIFQRQIA